MQLYIYLNNCENGKLIEYQKKGQHEQVITRYTRAVTTSSSAYVVNPLRAKRTKSFLLRTNTRSV